MHDGNGSFDVFVGVNLGINYVGVQDVMLFDIPLSGVLKCSDVQGELSESSSLFREYEALFEVLFVIPGPLWLGLKFAKLKGLGDLPEVGVFPGSSLGECTIAVRHQILFVFGENVEEHTAIGAHGVATDPHFQGPSFVAEKSPEAGVVHVEAVEQVSDAIIAVDGVDGDASNVSLEMFVTGGATTGLTLVVPVDESHVSYGRIFFGAMRGVGDVVASSADDYARHPTPVIDEMLEVSVRAGHSL